MNDGMGLIGRGRAASAASVTAILLSSTAAWGAGEVAEYQQADDPWHEQGRAAIEAAKATQPIIRPAKNLILVIGDGMSVPTLTAGRIFEGQMRGESGEEHLLSFEEFPYTALSKTYNTNQQVPDSAGTATAYHSGVKTKAGVIGVNAESLRSDCASSIGTEVTTALELAESIGMSTGIITTARVTHASPAAAYAHVPERDWESDADLTEEAKENGCKDIARQLIEFPYGDGIDVVMGGGRSVFLPETAADPEHADETGERQDGRNLTEEWLEQYDDGAYVWNQEQFDALDPDADHVLALFEPSHMQYESDRSTDAAGEPSLAEMTAKAIEILSQNPNGFYLFIEGGRIDHAHHEGNAYRALRDTAALSQAVGVADEMTDPNDTLIVVSADHGHTMTMSGYAVRGNPILGISITNDEHGLPESGPRLADDGLPYTTIMYANGPGAVAGPDEDASVAQVEPAAGDKSATQVEPAAGPAETEAEAETVRADLTNVDTRDLDFLQQSTVPLESETHGGADVAIHARGPMAYLVRGTVEQTYIFHVMDEAGSLRIRAQRIAAAQEDEEDDEERAEAD